MGASRKRSSSMDSNRAVCGRPHKSWTETEPELEPELGFEGMSTLFGTIACTVNPAKSSSNSSVVSSAGSDRGRSKKPQLTPKNSARCFDMQPSSTCSSTAATTAGSLEEKLEVTFMDLPTEIHLDIVDICFVLDGWGDNHRSNKDRKFIGGTVRELTLVNRYFRKLTAPYLFRSICINDNTEALFRDVLKESIQAMMVNPDTQQWLHKIQKFTVSLTRTAQPNHQYVEEDVILILDLIRPKIQRFVIEQHSTQWQLLCLVENIWRKWARNGFPHRIYNTKQLEIYAPFGHNWDFQFLANPYVNVERMWLDYNCDLLEPKTLKLSRLPNLEYLMVRSFPLNFLDDAIDLANFQGWSEHPANPKLAALARTLPQLKHLAMCGLLNGPIKKLATRLAPMRSLEQLDITDQQPVSAQQIMAARRGVHSNDAIDWAITHSRLMRMHAANTGRGDAAATFFKTLPKLKRICFVRDLIGTVFHAVRDEETGELERVEPRETITAERRYLKWQNPKAWLCGFPNVLGYKLFDERDGFCDTIASDATFWL
ncbi:f-box domain-containing protein [Diaporthe amygdali]|uniref:f-box domain-containing protein n=1 Tax=Phomopsis amygdali TaxID=1214568 RepID=UPI0022FEBBD7|nr:f-box domain-containing protein [Diaporthe amygdali]KAJ0124783.1 f-box domain-containing protein [Diaporthe amygdali]